jgi:hypothetical protein
MRNLTGRGKPYEAECLVDTGAVDCMAPANRLRAEGIKPEGRAVYELANREPVEYQYGFARIQFIGSETVAPVIFGPPDVEPILGVVALESAGITVEPVTKTLKRLPAKPLKIDSQFFALVATCPRRDQHRAGQSSRPLPDGRRDNSSTPADRAREQCDRGNRRACARWRTLPASRRRCK